MSSDARDSWASATWSWAQKAAAVPFGVYLGRRLMALRLLSKSGRTYPPPPNFASLFVLTALLAKAGPALRALQDKAAQLASAQPHDQFRQVLVALGRDVLEDNSTAPLAQVAVWAFAVQRTLGKTAPADDVGCMLAGLFLAQMALELAAVLPKLRKLDRDKLKDMLATWVVFAGLGTMVARFAFWRRGRLGADEPLPLAVGAALLRVAMLYRSLAQAGETTPTRASLETALEDVVGSSAAVFLLRVLRLPPQWIPVFAAVGAKAVPQLRSSWRGIVEAAAAPFLEGA